MMVGIGGTISIIQKIGFGLNWKIPFIQRYPEISKESSPKLEHQDVAAGLEARLPVGIVGMPVLGGRFRHCKDLGASQCLNLPVA